MKHKEYGIMFNLAPERKYPIWTIVEYGLASKKEAVSNIKDRSKKCRTQKKQYRIVWREITDWRPCK